MLRLVRTESQVERTAYNFCARESRSGVTYADVIVNPVHWPAWRDRLDAFVEALDRGFAEAEQDGLAHAGLCVSILRRQQASEAVELVEWILERDDPRIVALSIDGNEAEVGRTGPRFAEAFRRAREGGLYTTVHAGESSGPEGVRDAIEVLGADRIDHGVRAVEDPRLVEELAEWGICLGVCPSSNVTLGLYPDLPSHPIEALRRAGVAVTLNTDDPGLLGCSLEDEYLDCADQFGWPDDVLVELACNSFRASFCGDDLRRSALANLDLVSARAR